MFRDWKYIQPSIMGQIRFPEAKKVILKQGKAAESKLEVEERICDKSARKSTLPWKCGVPTSLHNDYVDYWHCDLPKQRGEYYSLKQTEIWLNGAWIQIQDSLSRDSKGEKIIWSF